LWLFTDLGGVSSELSGSLTSAKQIPDLIKLPFKLNEALRAFRRTAGGAEFVLFVDQRGDALMKIIVLAHASLSSHGGSRTTGM
jgi:hypothetical protein